MLTATPACRATSAIVTVRPLMRLLADRPRERARRPEGRRPVRRPGGRARGRAAPSARRTRSRVLSEGEAGQGDPSILEHHIEVTNPADIGEPGADLGEVLTSSPP
ncbi:hypothetical protein GCM10027187_52780 [Streptosporangium sandarakinum]